MSKKVTQQHLESTASFLGRFVPRLCDLDSETSTNSVCAHSPTSYFGRVQKCHRVDDNRSLGLSCRVAYPEARAGFSALLLNMCAFAQLGSDVLPHCSHEN